MNPEKLKQAEEFVKENIIDEYTFVHSQAVRKVAAELAEVLGGDRDVIDLACLFHDIARGKFGPLEHAGKGAEITEKAMTEIGFDKELIDQVVHCVAAHSTPWSKTGPEPATIEAKIVYDADMVQQISPFGLIKHIHEFKMDFEEMLKELEDTMVRKIPLGVFTDEAKKRIEERMPYVKDFIARAKE
jgi:uncharacterized protein